MDNKLKQNKSAMILSLNIITKNVLFCIFKENESIECDPFDIFILEHFSNPLKIFLKTPFGLKELDLTETLTPIDLDKVVEHFKEEGDDLKGIKISNNKKWLIEVRDKQGLVVKSLEDSREIILPKNSSIQTEVEDEKITMDFVFTQTFISTDEVNIFDEKTVDFKSRHSQLIKKLSSKPKFF